MLIFTVYVSAFRGKNQDADRSIRLKLFQVYFVALNETGFFSAAVWTGFAVLLGESDAFFRHDFDFGLLCRGVTECEL